MTRSLIRAVRWHLGRDRSDGAPTTPLYFVRCTTEACGGKSRIVRTLQEAQDWPFSHIAAHPSHTGYEARCTMYWRMTPTDDRVVPVDPPSTYGRPS
ncbi:MULTISPECIES: hypothetical protein [Streptomyces]|uniref:DUF7848 domain-containing protein n=1 Tax=Streptomyces albus (strain ATCC 21838 / DSM 41398 / FERM P-419 / JCM 4703 / NBRC 107858) TaxID=1081613 RepID=A0A0B5ERJ0_STRA4|nr:hypothetical protein [Streptomyces sp. SCSIO ZS0520]AJE80762.1 hypothetical protein SLNWT_0386 [Streptomyces albus]AOU75073.1 hypothetical protein SLNHY_0382 [Streptomyces albus]AYN30880.1 hypothetical protein DUI70_0377 [Streptomyces albus]